VVLQGSVRGPARARLWRRRGRRVRNMFALLVLLARGRMLRESLVRLQL